MIKKEKTFCRFYVFLFVKTYPSIPLVTKKIHYSSFCVCNQVALFFILCIQPSSRWFLLVYPYVAGRWEFQRQVFLKQLKSVDSLVQNFIELKPSMKNLGRQGINLPVIKLFVPSIGSKTHTYSASFSLHLHPFSSP